MSVANPFVDQCEIALTIANKRQNLPRPLGECQIIVPIPVEIRKTDSLSKVAPNMLGVQTAPGIAISERLGKNISHEGPNHNKKRRKAKDIGCGRPK